MSNIGTPTGSACNTLPACCLDEERGFAGFLVKRATIVCARGSLLRSYPSPASPPRRRRFSLPLSPCGRGCPSECNERGRVRGRCRTSCTHPSPGSRFAALTAIHPLPQGERGRATAPGLNSTFLFIPFPVEGIYPPSRPIDRGAFDQRRQMLGRGAVAGSGRWRCDANTRPAVQAALSWRAAALMGFLMAGRPHILSDEWRLSCLAQGWRVLSACNWV